jgi:diguanylate cyclase (GGDEF)-like protein
MIENQGLHMTIKLKSSISLLPSAKKRSVSSKRASAAQLDLEPDVLHPKQSQVSLLKQEVDGLRRQLHEAQARMVELEAKAEEDPLTEILNRRGFERELKRSLAFVRRYDMQACLLYLDLDGFKQINDQLGHFVGDELLQYVVGMLLVSIRSSDVLARIGGDEFAVLMWNLSREEALLKAEQLEQVIANACLNHDGKDIRVGASIGVTMILSDDDSHSVMARGDGAMYLRKSAKRGRFTQ